MIAWNSIMYNNARWGRLENTYYLMGGRPKPIISPGCYGATFLLVIPGQVSVISKLPICIVSPIKIYESQVG